jgi:Transposase DDE domain
MTSHLLCPGRPMPYRHNADRRHHTRTRRSWRKLHLSVDAATGQIVAAALTSKEVDDAAQVGPMLDQVIGSLSSVTADEPMTRMAFTPMLAPIIPTRR